MALFFVQYLIPSLSLVNLYLSPEPLEKEQAMTRSPQCYLYVKRVCACATTATRHMALYIEYNHIIEDTHSHQNGRRML